MSKHDEVTCPECHERRANRLIGDVSGWIEATMIEKGLSQSELARRLGTSRNYVHNLIRGNQNLTLGTLTKIAAALGKRVRVNFL